MVVEETVCVTLPNIWQVCKFGEEIVMGVPDYSKFAVELHSVLDHSADPIYQDASKFLSNTYLTTRMEVFLRDVLRRVVRNEGQPAYVIDTEFGGGKTHTLLLIYHILKNAKIGSEYIAKYGFDSKYGLKDVPSTRVIAIDCRQLHKNTLWGEIAEKVTKYGSVEALDREKKPISDIGLIKAFFDQPTVLLIDELPLHLLQADSERIGNTTLAELTVTFLQNLISAVSAVKNSVLVLTLTAEQQLYQKYASKVRLGIKQLTDFKVDQLVGDMKEAMARQVQFVIPVDNKEVYNVVVTRLVKDIDKTKRKQIVDEFFAYYEQKGLLSLEIDYRKKMEAAYPFHPLLIDTLYGRVSSIPQFNKTRGLLRLLALVLHNIYKNKEVCSVVNLSSVQVSDTDISDELTIKLDRGYLKQAIEVDCITKARSMDKSRNAKVVEKTARSILLYSLIGAAKMSGIKPADLKLAVCEPGMDVTLIDKALEDIETEFWYIVPEGGEYYFGQEANINKMIQEYVREVKDSEVREKIHGILEDDLLIPTADVLVAIWKPEQLEDNEKLKIFAIDYREGIDDDNAKERLGYLLERNSNGSIRTFQNTITFLYPEKAGIDQLIKDAKEVCAIEKTAKDERVKLDKSKMNKLNSRLSLALGQFVEECMAVYSKIAYPNGADIRTDSLSTTEKSDNLTAAVFRRLHGTGKLQDRLSSDAITDIVKSRSVISAAELYQTFKKDRSQRFITTGSVILNAATQAVKEGKIGYATELVEEAGRYRGTTGQEIRVEWDGYLIDTTKLAKTFECKYCGMKFDVEELRSKHEKEHAEKTFECKYCGMKFDVAELRSKHEKEHAEKEYLYKFNLANIDEMIKVIRKVSVVKVGGNKDASMTAKLEKEGDTISIESRLVNIQAIISLLKQLSDRFEGTGTLYIHSKEDVSEELAGLGLEPAK